MRIMTFVDVYDKIVRAEEAHRCQSGEVASGSSPQFVAATPYNTTGFSSFGPTIGMTTEGIMTDENSSMSESGYQSTVTPVGQYTSIAPCSSIQEVNPKDFSESDSPDEESDEQDDRPP